MNVHFVSEMLQMFVRLKCKCYTDLWWRTGGGLHKQAFTESIQTASPNDNMNRAREVNETKCQQVKSLGVSLNQTLKGFKGQADFVQERKETNKEMLKDTREKTEMKRIREQHKCSFYSTLSVSLFMQYCSIVFTLLKCYTVISWFC